MTGTYLIVPEHVPQQAAFPAIDAHNHLWNAWERVPADVQVLDACGVAMSCDLTANLALRQVDGGYVYQSSPFENFRRATSAAPKRLYAFTTATFCTPRDQPLFTDPQAFVARTLETLREHVRQGARGLKILKELGLHYRDGDRNLVFADDERLAPIWEECARLGIPVLIHQSDPVGFFDPIAPANEHYDSLRKYPDWSFADARFPRKAELIRRRDRLVAAHPRTTFILPHVANYPEDLAYVSALLDRCPNVHIDFSARLDELGRQPYTARAFFLRHQERILFGTDMPATPEMYRCYFRFLETYDENFVPPDYDGTFSRHRWRICGIGLPRHVLAKIYYRNALRLMPGLRPAYRAACAALKPETEATEQE